MSDADQCSSTNPTQSQQLNGNDSAKGWGLALNHPDPMIAQAYREVAIVGARSLPDRLDWALLTACIADTRGESFSFAPNFESFLNGLKRWQILLKEDLETAARRGKVDLEEAKNERLHANVCWALAQDSGCRIDEALRRYFSVLSEGKTELAPLPALKAARETWPVFTAEWLDYHRIPHYSADWL
jgi:hypothetical protein